LLNPLPYAASDDARSALASIGRTEDVAFSPDERRLAIAGFESATCLLIDIEMDFSGGQKRIALGRTIAFTSPNLVNPHGLAFVDPDTLIVADRMSQKVSVFSLPAAGDGGEVHQVCLDGDPVISELTEPGSVAVVSRGSDRYDVLVCSNDANTVSRHFLLGGAHPRVERSDVLLKATLSIPDGVAVSPSGRWIAVSSHWTHSVQMFRYSEELNAATRPAGILYGAGFPHGVRFSSDGLFVIVADAGDPVVRAYRADDDDWCGLRQPVATSQIMTEEVFRRGRINPQEGGPKGIDVDRGMNVLVVTCDEQPLAFFDLSSVLGR